MKRLIFISLLLVLFFGGMALASEPVISGKTFVVGECDLVFAQGPFGPGECGVVTITCGPDSMEFSFSYDAPILEIAALKFVFAGGKLYYLDPMYLVLIEE